MHRDWNGADSNIERMRNDTGLQRRAAREKGRAGQRMPGGDPAKTSVVHSWKSPGTDVWAVRQPQAGDSRLGEAAAGVRGRINLPGRESVGLSAFNQSHRGSSVDLVPGASLGCAVVSVRARGMTAVWRSPCRHPTLGNRVNSRPPSQRNFGGMQLNHGRKTKINPLRVNL